MKKRISTILAIVLTIALLASSFVMLGVHADEEQVATETLTIGTSEYEIFTDKKFSALDAINAAVEGLVPDSTAEQPNNVYAQGPEVLFDDQAWSFVSSGLWNPDVNRPTYVKTHTDYNQLCFYTTEPGYGRKSISVYNGKLYVNAAHGWQSKGDQQVRPIQMKFTATEDGSVVLYDIDGTVYAPAKNVTPFWAWISASKEPDGEWASFEIYKNGTKLWPKGTQDNKIEAAGEEIEFPDLGAIKVKAGDVISIEVSAYGDRTGIFMNPAIAYAKVEETEEEEEEIVTEDIVLGENTYTIESNNKFNAYDTLKAFASELDVNAYPAVNMSKSVWQVRTARWNESYDGTLHYGPAPYSSYPAFMIGNSSGHWTTQQNATTVVLDTNGYLAVSPFVKDDKTASAIIDLDFKAPKTGKVLIYDILGAVKSPTSNDASPYWAWLKNHNNKVEVTVLLNGKEIWPCDETVDNYISDINDTVAIPDLGPIDVLRGDRLTLRLQEVNNKSEEKLPSRDVVFTDIEVAYIYDPNAPKEEESDDPNKEIITVGNSNYLVIKDSKYDLYSGITELTKGLADKSEVKFKNNWKFAYKYTNDVDYGIDPWGGELSYVYGIPYYSTTTKGTGDVNLRGIYPNSTFSLNTWHNCFFLSSATLLTDSESVYISPACDGLKDNKIAEDKWGPVMQITFHSNKSGKAVLYDPTGVFDGDVARSPFWANESDNATTKIEIYKNNKKIWPTDGDVIISKTNKRVAFPDLGEIDVKIGDKIKFVFYGNTKSPSSRTGVICNPGIAFTEVTAVGAIQTDANFASQVMVLVSVITVLGAVAITGGVILKKRAHN